MLIQIKRSVPVLLVLAFFCLTAAGSAADGIIHNLRSKLTEHELLISYQLRGAMNDETWRAINAGERLNFNYDIQLIEEHHFWFDRKVAQLQVSNSVKLDILTSQYHLLRQFNGEMIEVKTTTRQADVEQWLTEMENLRVIGRTGLASHSSYLLQVRAHLKSDFIFYIVPWEIYTPWEAIKVQIP